jgi:hypothetical protein
VKEVSDLTAKLYQTRSLMHAFNLLMTYAATLINYAMHGDYSYLFHLCTGYSQVIHIMHPVIHTLHTRFTPLPPYPAC